jgi:glycosyltransferase involved in cell wall biosynthesis
MAEGKKRVALFGNFLSVWGYNKATCEDLSERLTSNGWEVTIASCKKEKLLRVADMVSTAYKKKDLYSVAVVEVYSGRSFFWAEAVCEMLKVVTRPYILALHGGSLPDFGNNWPRRVRRLFRSAKYVTAPSGYLREKMKIFRDDILVVPNPIQLSEYPFRVRREAKPKVVWVRAFHRIYNPTLAPRVVALLEKEGIRVELVMVGPDKGDGSLEETQGFAAKLGTEKALLFAGAVNKRRVPEFLAANDIFLNTTNIDNTPVSIVEAMAAGLCIVSTNVGGIPYLLQNGVDALLVPSDDASSMAEAVKRILSEPGLSEKLASNARKKAEDFSWDHVLPIWENLLENAFAR